MPNRTLRCDFIGGSDARIIMAGPARALGKQAQMRAEACREDPPLRATTKDPTRRWYETITGLLLLLFPIRNKRVRFFAFRSVAAKEAMRWRESRR